MGIDENKGVEVVNGVPLEPDSSDIHNVDEAMGDAKVRKTLGVDVPVWHSRMTTNAHPRMSEGVQGPFTENNFMTEPVGYLINNNSAIPRNIINKLKVKGLKVLALGGGDREDICGMFGKDGGLERRDLYDARMDKAKEIFGTNDAGRVRGMLTDVTTRDEQLPARFGDVSTHDVFGKTRDGKWYVHLHGSTRVVIEDGKPVKKTSSYIVGFINAETGLKDWQLSRKRGC